MNPTNDPHEDELREHLHAWGRDAEQRSPAFRGVWRRAQRSWVQRKTGPRSWPMGWTLATATAVVCAIATVWMHHPSPPAPVAEPPIAAVSATPATASTFDPLAPTDFLLTAANGSSPCAAAPSWPSKVNDWLLASFYHFTNFPQPSYTPPYDEILQIHLDGHSKYLVRTGGNYSMGAGRGSSTDMFWAMPLAAPQANGKRISFNTNRSGTIDQCILYIDGAMSPQ